PVYKEFFWIFVATCILLGWLGSKPPEGWYVVASRILTAWYFIHFIIVLPLLRLIETPRPLPSSISEAVLKSKAKAAVVLLAVGVGVGGLLSSSAPLSAAEPGKPPQEIPAKLSWSVAGPVGKFDRAQLQRGVQVYRQVCQHCHSRQLLPLR